MKYICIGNTNVVIFRAFVCKHIQICMLRVSRQTTKYDLIVPVTC